MAIDAGVGWRVNCGAPQRTAVWPGYFHSRSRRKPVSFSYDWKTVALYALAVGATHEELDYLYEARGPRVLPTFAVIPAYHP